MRPEQASERLRVAASMGESAGERGYPYAVCPFGDAHMRQVWMTAYRKTRKPHAEIHCGSANLIQPYQGLDSGGRRGPAQSARKVTESR